VHPSINVVTQHAYSLPLFTISFLIRSLALCSSIIANPRPHVHYPRDICLPSATILQRHYPLPSTLSTSLYIIVMSTSFRLPMSSQLFLPIPDMTPSHPTFIVLLIYRHLQEAPLKRGREQELELPRKAPKILGAASISGTEIFKTTAVVDHPKPSNQVRILLCNSNVVQLLLAYLV
jgi:hypothetical protein